MDDIQLQALFAADAPPARDPAFVLAVLDRMEKARLRQQFIWLVMSACVGAVMLFAFAPLLAWLTTSGDILSLFVFTALVLASLWLVRRDLPGAELLSI